MSDNIQDQINTIQSSITTLNGDILVLRNLVRSAEQSQLVTMTQVRNLTQQVDALSTKVDALAARVSS